MILPGIFDHMEESRDNPALLVRRLNAAPMKTPLGLASGDTCVQETSISGDSPTGRSGLPASDLDLLRSAAKGASAAFRELVDRHSPGLFRLAQWLSGNRADAEDVLQETFTGAFKGMSRFDGRAAVKTWLTQILIRQASKMRHRRSRYRFPARPDPSGGGSAPVGESAEPSIASGTITIDQRIDLANMIQELPEDHRQIILLREIDGMSYEEIAQTLNIPRGTVESRIHRARAGLRKLLGGYE
jgi:RNA polymerase sigma-70 factor (ECF subfamily)